MSCLEMEVVEGCLQENGEFINVLIHYSYAIDEDGEQTINGIRVTEPDGTVISVTDHNLISIGSCKIDTAPVCYDNDTKGYMTFHTASDGTITILKQYESDFITEINPLLGVISCC